MREEKDFFGKKKGSVKAFFICLAVFFWIEFALMFGSVQTSGQRLVGDIQVVELFPLAILVYGIVNLMRAIDSRRKGLEK